MLEYDSCKKTEWSRQQKRARVPRRNYIIIYYYKQKTNEQIKMSRPQLSIKRLYNLRNQFKRSNQLIDKIGWFQ